jgi:hypothetical protein
MDKDVISTNNNKVLKRLLSSNSNVYKIAY